MMSLKELVATKSSVTYAIMLIMIWFGSTVVAQFNLYTPIPIQNIVMLLGIVLLLLMSRKTDMSENKTAITPDFLIPLEKVSRDLRDFQTTIEDMLKGQAIKDNSIKETLDGKIIRDISTGNAFLDIFAKFMELSVESNEKPVDGEHAVKEEPIITGVEGGTVG